MTLMNKCLFARENGEKTEHRQKNFRNSIQLATTEAKKKRI